MNRVAARYMALTLAVIFAGTSFVDAAGPPGRASATGTTSLKTETETETEFEAKLAGVGSQTSAKGFAEAESEVETVTNGSTSTTTTKASLTIHVRRLKLSRGSTVTFQLNGTTIGTGTVRSHHAFLRLSTKKGDTVPTVSQGNTLTVLDPNSATVLTGTFGAPETETE